MGESLVLSDRLGSLRQVQERSFVVLISASDKKRSGESLFEHISKSIYHLGSQTTTVQFYAQREQANLKQGLNPLPDLRRLPSFASASALPARAVATQMVADQRHHDMLQAVQRQYPDLVHPAGDVLVRRAEDVAEENVEQAEVLGAGGGLLTPDSCCELAQRHS